MAASLRFWYLWLLGPLLFGGACQRATYSFQAPAPAHLPLAPLSVLAAASPDTQAHLAAVLRRAAPRRWRARPRAASVRQLRQPPARLAWRVARCLPGLARRPAARAAPTQEPLPMRTRSRGVALLLAVVPLLLGFPLGLHNFYLGYTGRGIATVLLTLAALTFLYLGAIGFFFGILFGASSGQLALFLIGLVIYSGLYIWQLVDALLIVARRLPPRNGEYEPGFF